MTNKKENFSVLQLLVEINTKRVVTKNTQEEINEDIDKIMTMLSDKKTYSFVVREIEQEDEIGSSTSEHATLMSSEEVEKRELLTVRHSRDANGFLADSGYEQKCWNYENDESEDMIYLNDETFELLFDVSL